MPKKKFVHEAKYLSLNVKKAKKILKWKPKWSVKKAIKLTYDWYDMIETLNKTNIQLVTKDQISDYMKL